MNPEDQIIDTDVVVLKALKKIYASQKTTEAKHIVSLINTLAAEKCYLDIFPFIKLSIIDDILNGKHDVYRLIQKDLLGMDEGSMAMEYDYQIIIQNDDTFQAYAIYLNNSHMIQGECWDDYVADDADELFEVKKVKEEKEVKVKYVVVD